MKSFIPPFDKLPIKLIIPIILLCSDFSNAQIPSYNKISFTRQQSATDWDIWIMDSDGGNQQRLLDSPDKDMNPHFSSDGNFIVFTRTSGSAPNQTNDVYIVNSNGTNAINLTADISESAVGPKFSWDGNKIAFFRSYQNMGFVLSIMNKDGTNKQYIRDQNNNPVQGDSPFFTPDNQWLVFQRVNPQAQQGAIYKVPLAGGTVIQMTQVTNFDELPRVSPNGLYVIFKHEPNPINKSDIARMSINQTINDSSTIVNLTNTTAQWEDSPMYSYEGDKIAFMSTTDGTYNSMEIFVMNADGTGRTRLTNNSVQDFDPTFSPAIPTLPSAPTLLSPVNASTNQPTNLTLTWNSVSGATAYHLQVAVDSNFMSRVLCDTNILTTSKQLSSLENNRKHFWRVRAKNSFGWGTFSTIWNFRTIVAVPAAPTLVSPINGATSITANPTLNWNASIWATSYCLQVAADSLFNSLVFNDSTIIDTSKEVGPLLNNTRYYWRVNAKNQVGTSNWSAVWNFTTLLTNVEIQGNALPIEYQLAQNYPNPFNPITTIEFRIPHSAFITLKVYDMLGRELVALVNEYKEAGRHTVEWNAENLPSGVYIYKLIAGSFTASNKMLLMK